MSTTIVKGIASTGLVTIRGERYICTTTHCIWFYIYLKKRRNVRCFNHSLKCSKFFNIQTISLTSRKWKSIFLLFNTWRLELRSRRVFLKYKLLLHLEKSESKFLILQINFDITEKINLWQYQFILFLPLKDVKSGNASRSKSIQDFFFIFNKNHLLHH